MSWIQELRHLKWHSLLLLVVLLWFGLQSLLAVVQVLAAAPPAAGLGLFEYYFYLAAPLLTLVAAGLLSQRSKWVLVPFVLLPIAYFSLAAHFYPALLSFGSHILDRNYLMLIPRSYLLQIGFYCGCIIYGAFSYKWGHLK